MWIRNRDAGKTQSRNKLGNQRIKQPFMAQIVKRQCFFVKADGWDLNGKSRYARRKIRLAPNKQVGIARINLELVLIKFFGQIAGHGTQPIAAHGCFAAIGVDDTHLRQGSGFSWLIDNQNAIRAA